MSWQDWENDRIITVTYIPREAPAVATLTRQRDDLTAHVARLESENVALRRQNARMRAQIDGAPRKARAWETALAWLVCRLDAANRKMKGWGL